MFREIFATLLLSPLLAQAGELTIQVEGVTDATGKIAALIFANADGFPNESAKAARKIQVDARPGITEVKLPDFKPGRYAVCVIHDSNQNATLDRNFFGIPKEGVGISNGIRREMPSFDKAVIDIKDDDVVVLPLKYW